MVEALWEPDLQGNWAEGYSQYNRITLIIWPPTLQVWYHHAPHVTAFLMLLYAIYRLRTAPVSTRPKDAAIHSPRPSMFPLPWSGIASIWHSSSSQAPWGTARSAPMQWPSAPESPHLSVPVSTSASSCSSDTPSPRMCTLCILHTTTFSAGLPICCRRWSCWNPKHNIYCREFVALIATTYRTWLMPISLTVGTYIEVDARQSVLVTAFIEDEAKLRFFLIFIQLIQLESTT